MSYTIGFMFADGGISINPRGGCYFALYSNDEDLLKKIKLNHVHKFDLKSPFTLVPAFKFAFFFTMILIISKF